MELVLIKNTEHVESPAQRRKRILETPLVELTAAELSEAVQIMDQHIEHARSRKKAFLRERVRRGIAE